VVGVLRHRERGEGHSRGSTKWRGVPTVVRFCGLRCLVVVGLAFGCGGKAIGTGDTPNGIGQGGTPNGTNEPPVCLAQPGVNQIYQQPSITGIALAGDSVIVTGLDIARIPLSGGTPVTIAQPSGPYGLLVLGGEAYFTVGNALYSVPISGGDPIWLLDSPPPMYSSAADETSLYFQGIPWGILKLTPPSTTGTELALDANLGINAIAPYGDNVYVAASDPSTSSGVIERVPKAGGPAQRLVSGLGLLGSFVADATGLCWSEDPLVGYGPGRVAHAALDGTQMTTVLSHGARSLAVLDGDLYFASNTSTQVETIGMVPRGGGNTVVIASGARTPGMLRVTGFTVVWVDPSVKAMSDSTPMSVMTACVPATQ